MFVFTKVDCDLKRHADVIHMLPRSSLADFKFVVNFAIHTGLMRILFQGRIFHKLTAMGKGNKPLL